MLCSICSAATATTKGMCDRCAARTTICVPATKEIVRDASRDAYRESRRLESGQTDRIRTPAERAYLAREADYRTAENEAERRGEMAGAIRASGRSVVGWDACGNPLTKADLDEDRNEHRNRTHPVPGWGMRGIATDRR